MKIEPICNKLYNAETYYDLYRLLFRKFQCQKCQKLPCKSYSKLSSEHSANGWVVVATNSLRIRRRILFSLNVTCNVTKFVVGISHEPPIATACHFRTSFNRKYIYSGEDVHFTVSTGCFMLFLRGKMQGM